jgi:hypothetical protein
MTMATSKKASRCTGTTQLPTGFCPTADHVICGKGNPVYNHKGNVRFRLIIAMSVERYIAAPNRSVKSAIVQKIAASIGPKMVRLDVATNRWCLLGNKESREKVGQVIRVMVTRIQSSDSKGRETQNLRVPSPVNKSGSSLEEITSVEPSSTPPRPLSSQPSQGMRVLKKGVGSTKLTSGVLPDSTTLSSTTLRGPSKDHDVFPDDMVSGISPGVLYPQEVSSSIPPCLTHQSSTDWFDDDEMDVSCADLADTEVFDDFFETFALAA